MIGQIAEIFKVWPVKAFTTQRTTSKAVCGKGGVIASPCSCQSARRVAAISFRPAAAADVTLLDDMAVLLAFLQMAPDSNEQRGEGEKKRGQRYFFFGAQLICAEIPKYFDSLLFNVNKLVYVLLSSVNVLFFISKSLCELLFIS